MWNKVVQGIFILAITSFAFSADSTVKANSAQSAFSINSTPVSSKIEDDKSLKKQQKYIRPNTTWSKIKDLFM